MHCGEDHCHVCSLAGYKDVMKYAVAVDDDEYLPEDQAEIIRIFYTDGHWEIDGATKDGKRYTEACWSHGAPMDNLDAESIDWEPMKSRGHALANVPHFIREVTPHLTEANVTIMKKIEDA